MVGVVLESVRGSMRQISVHAVFSQFTGCLCVIALRASCSAVSTKIISGTCAWSNWANGIFPRG